MSKFQDLADYILHNKGSGAMSSDSEMDDIPESRIELPEDYLDKKGGTNVAIKLHELGPRLKLRLVKIEEGFCRGNVVFHSIIDKSTAEVKRNLDGMKNKRELKEKRKRVQEENIKRKNEKSEAKIKKEAKEEERTGRKKTRDEENEEPKAKDLYKNFQKKHIVPNIASNKARAPGISKGMWKKELKRQVTGVVEKRERRGKRITSSDAKDKKKSA